LETSVGRVLETAPNINPYWVSGWFLRFVSVLLKKTIKIKTYGSDI
jgi:hypothetical protein